MKTKVPEKKKRYYCLGFTFIGKALERYTNEYDFTYVTFTSSIKGSINTINAIKQIQNDKINPPYDVVHLSSWESLLVYKKKIPNQIFIAHPHGFIAGINYDRTIKDIPFFRRQVHLIIKLFFDKCIRKKYQQADIMYVSTPNMLEHAKKIREDAIWLPNPINKDLLNPSLPKIVLEGNPSVFMPTRMHTYKNPLFGVNLFKKIKAKYPKAKLHVVRYPTGDDDPLFNEMMTMLPKEDVIIHPRIDRTQVGTYYKSADLLLGQFNENYANFSLVELDGMACGAAVVTLDKYEIKNEYSSLENLEKLAFRLLEDKKFRKKIIDRNLKYVSTVHSEKNVANILQKDIANARSKLKIQ